MFAKHVSELTYSDIFDLVEVRKEEEGYHLDYKSTFSDSNGLKKILTKEVSAFANTGGGYLIFGIKDKTLDIVGIEREIHNKSIVEWVNQILSTNIEPPIFYYDPKVIELPDEDKIILVLHIPESTKKPHFVNETNQYFIRINDSAKPANHNQIRDMFEFSRNRTEEFDNFLKKRNLYDSDDPNFGVNNNSKNLLSSIEDKKPFVLFSMIPKYPNEDKFSVPVEELKNWLKSNEKGYTPWKDFSVYHFHRYFDVKMDGVVISHPEENGINYFFELLNYGFIEAGFSKQLFLLNHPINHSSYNLVFLSKIIGYEMAFIGLSKRFYEYLKYFDDVLLQISIVNVEGFTLSSFHKNHNKIDWYNTPKNRYHNAIKLNYSFNPSSITEADILDITKVHSERICRAFGYEKDYGFVGDDINMEVLYRFWDY